MRSGSGGLGPSACSGSTTTAPAAHAGDAADPAGQPDRRWYWSPTLRLVGAAPASWAAAAVATAGTTARHRRRRPDSAASGNRGPGAWSITAAYLAGSTNTAVSSYPVAGSVACVDHRGRGGDDAGHRGDLPLQRWGDRLAVRGLDDRVGADLLPGCGHLATGYRGADHGRERHHGEHQHQGERRQDGAGRGAGGPRQADERDHPARPARDPGQLRGPAAGSSAARRRPRGSRPAPAPCSCTGRCSPSRQALVPQHDQPADRPRRPAPSRCTIRRAAAPAAAGPARWPAGDRAGHALRDHADQHRAGRA